MEIEIGPTVWTVEERMGMTDYGRTEARWAIIEISPNQDSSQYRDTLLHEVLHAIVATYGIVMGYEGDQEEQIIKTLAPALLDTLRSNPDLVDKLLAKRI